jgi:glycosyltransferase involved in cell wall biosynthesis
MFVETAHGDAGHGSPVAARVARPAEWTAIVPFFNERDYLPATLASLARQRPAPRVVLVDNGSTDGSGDVAVTACRRLGLDFVALFEPRPGKVFALQAGLAAVCTRYVATCDADTHYPENYLAQAGRLLAIDGTAAVGAFYADAQTTPRQRLTEALHINVMGRLLAWQCHAGGAGQAFRTDCLRAAGGFDPAIWNLVLEDHEIMHRVGKTGAVRYGLNFWCAPSNRDRDRASIRWDLFERILYHVTPRRWQGRFFYDLLAPRLQARKLSSERIRERPYQSLGDLKDAAPVAVCG